MGRLFFGQKTMFDKAFSRLIPSEGGYQCDPKDRGNWTGGKVGVGQLKGTKCGIAAMTYPTLDIERLTNEQIKAIYYEDFWLAFRLDDYPSALQYQLFDAAVNHGFRRAAKMLQKAVGAYQDGVVGPKTLAAVRAMDVNDVLFLFLSARIKFYTRISTFSVYGRGWMDRVAECLSHAANDN